MTSTCSQSYSSKLHVQQNSGQSHVPDGNHELQDIRLIYIYTKRAEAGAGGGQGGAAREGSQLDAADAQSNFFFFHRDKKKAAV